MLKAAQAEDDRRFMLYQSEAKVREDTAYFRGFADALASISADEPYMICEIGKFCDFRIQPGDSVTRGGDRGSN